MCAKTPVCAAPRPRTLLLRPRWPHPRNRRRRSGRPCAQKRCCDSPAGSPTAAAAWPRGRWLGPCQAALHFDWDSRTGRPARCSPSPCPKAAEHAVIEAVRAAGDAPGVEDLLPLLYAVGVHARIAAGEQHGQPRGHIELPPREGVAHLQIPRAGIGRVIAPREHRACARLGGRAGPHQGRKGAGAHAQRQQARAQHGLPMDFPTKNFFLQSGNTLPLSMSLFIVPMRASRVNGNDWKRKHTRRLSRTAGPSLVDCLLLFLLDSHDVIRVEHMELLLAGLSGLYCQPLALRRFHHAGHAETARAGIRYFAAFSDKGLQRFA